MKTKQELEALLDGELAEMVAEICGWMYDPVTNELVFADGSDVLAYDWMSIDAIQAAVKQMIEPKNDAVMQTYIMRLLAVVSGQDTGGSFSWYDLESVANATAKERTIAFILTMQEV